MSAERPEFYLDTYSNASLEYFPNNTLTHFSNHLINPIGLEGPYEVGLSEIMFPNNLAATTGGKMILIAASENDQEVKNAPTEYFPTAFDVEIVEKPSLSLEASGYSYTPDKNLGNRLFYFSIPESKYFTSSDDLIYYLDKVLTGMDTGSTEFELALQRRKDPTADADYQYPLRVSYDESNGVRIFLRDKNINLAVSASIARVLGFPLNDNEWLRFNESGIYRYPRLKPDLEGNKPRFFNVYTNIIRPIFSGGTLASNLRSVTIPIKRTETPNEVVSIQFNPAHYIPVAVSSLNTIQFQLLDATGKQVSFLYGLIYCRLHFRPKAVQKTLVSP